MRPAKQIVRLPSVTSSFSARVGVERLSAILEEISAAADGGGTARLDLGITIEFAPDAVEDGEVVVSVRVTERPSRA